MKIFKPIIEDLATFSGSVDISGSLTITQNLNVVGELQGAATTASYVSLANVDGFTEVSSSIEQRISSQELFSSSLDTTILKLSGSFSGSFVGDGSQLSGVTSYTDSDTLAYINSIGVVSGSEQLAEDISGSFTPVSESLAGRITPLEGSVNSLNAATSSYALQANISGALGPNATLIRSLTATGITGSFTELSSSIASDINTKLNFADTGSFAKTNINNSFGGVQTFESINVNGTASFGFVQSVTGSATYIGSQYVVVNAQTEGARFAGIQVYDQESTLQHTASLAWDSLNNKWIYTNASGSTYTGGGLISGPRNTGSIGEETFPSLNYIVRGQGGDHIYNSNIIDNDTTVKIGINTEITGSLIVSSGITGDLTGNAATATSASYAATGPFLSSYTETDTLATVTGRGASTSVDISIANGQPKLRLKETDSTNVDKELLVSGGDFYIRNLNDNDTAGTNLLLVDSSGHLSATGRGQFAGALRVTETGTAQHILIGNQDSSGTNAPGMIRGVNAALQFGVGDSWTGEGGNMTVRMELKNDGNAYFTNSLGIGTTSPSAKLDVLSASYDVIKWTRSGGKTGRLYADSGGVGIWTGTTFSDTAIYMIPDTSMDFRVNGSQRMFINSSGDVGINTTSPFTIGGTAKTTIRVGATNEVALSLGFSNTNMSYIRQFGNGIFQWQTYNSGNSGELHLQPYGGSVGIGTTSPDDGVHIYGAGNGKGLKIEATNGQIESAVLKLYPKSPSSDERNWSIAAYKDSSDDLSFSSSNVKGGDPYTSGNTRMLIEGITGNVGIGTTSPSARLDIRGAAGDGAELLRIESSGNVPDGGYHWMSSAMATSQTTNANIIHLIGVAENFKNSGYLGFHYAGNNSDDNYLKFGGYAADDLMVIKMNGNVGIGTTTPGSKLTVQGSTAGATVLDIQGTSGQLFSVTDDLTGTIFAASDISGIPILSVDAAGTVDVDGDLNVNNGLVYIDPDRSSTYTVGIGTSSPTAKVHIQNDNFAFYRATQTSGNSLNVGVSGNYGIIGTDNGDIIVTAAMGGVILSTGGSSWSAYSDERLKTINHELSGSLDKLNTLRTVNYSWNTHSTGSSYYGVIAQEVEEVLPELVGEGRDGYKTVAYTELIPVLIDAIKELTAENTAIKARLDAIEGN
jgi:hypothetical protein